MRRLVCLFCLGTLAVPGWSQDGTATFYDAVDLGFYASPDVRFSSLNDQAALLAGGRAGLALDLGDVPALLIGAGAYALMSDVEADAEFEDGVRLLQFAYAGLDLQYLMRLQGPVDVVLQLFMGAGSVNYRAKGNALNFSRRDSEDFLVFEPGLGAQLRLARFLRVAGHLNYRTIDDIQGFRGATNRSLGGLSGMLALTLGSF